MNILSFVSKYLGFIIKPAILGILLILLIRLGTAKIPVFKKNILTIKTEGDIIQKVGYKGILGGSIQKKHTMLLLSAILGVIGQAGIIITEQMPAASTLSVKNIVTQASSLCIIASCIMLPGIIAFSRLQKAIMVKVRTFFIFHIGIMFGTYLFIFLFVFLFQEPFIIKNNFFFQPTSITQQDANSYLKSNVDTVQLTTSDNTKLQGWLIKNSDEEKMPLIVFFGGSAREVSYLIDYSQNLEGWAVALINYRGYGLSEGAPSEQTIINDAVFVYDTFAQRSDIDNGNIVAMGWSLGANVAALLSEKREVAGTVLIAPSDSETHWFQRSCFPYLPLWLFRTQYFDAMSVADSIKSPLLCLIGGKDINNPPDLARGLAENWLGEKTVIEYENEDHSLIFNENSSLKEIQKFLKNYKGTLSPE